MAKRRMSLESAREYVKCSKFLIFTKEDSKRLQEKLFKIGCQWWVTGQVVCHTDGPFLFVGHDLELTFGEKTDYNTFEESKNSYLDINDVLDIELDLPNETVCVKVPRKRSEIEDLLIKDLSGRIPYGIKCCFGVDKSVYQIDGMNPEASGASEVQATHIKSGTNSGFTVKACRPYLFPLSSMTNEQLKEMQEIIGNPNEACVSVNTLGLELWLNSVGTDPTIDLDVLFELQDWLNKNKFDYRGLIPKGAAKDATGLDIY